MTLRLKFTMTRVSIKPRAKQCVAATTTCNSAWSKLSEPDLVSASSKSKHLFLSDVSFSSLRVSLCMSLSSDGLGFLRHLVHSSA